MQSVGFVALVLLFHFILSIDHILILLLFGRATIGLSLGSRPRARSRTRGSATLRTLLLVHLLCELVADLRHSLDSPLDAIAIFALERFLQSVDRALDVPAYFGGYLFPVVLEALF